VNALLRLTLKQILGGRKLWLVALFLSMPVLLVGAVLAAEDFVLSDEESKQAGFSVLLYVLYPQSLCILTSLVYGATLLAAEIEDKTLVYLFTRSLPRWQILTGKYVVTASTLSAMSSASMSVCFLITGMPFGLDLWLGLLASVVGACFTYTAVFALLGLLVPRRAIPVGLMYAVVFEFLLSLVPAVINEFTTSHYLRSLAFEISGVPLPPEVLQFVGGASIPKALGALVFITALALTLAGALVHRREWPLTEGV
jgi:ABC-2 type transport system permease protein